MEHRRENMKKFVFIYDVDGTLIKGSMQDNGIIQALGEDPKTFWEESTELAVANNSDRTLMYLYNIIKTGRSKNIPITKELLYEQGKKFKYYPGVEEWFDKINEFAKNNDAEIKHYLISSGNKETLKGSTIAKEFDRIFACEYIFDYKGEADWLKTLVNHTTKTQYIFRIRKNCMDTLYEDESVNKYMTEEDGIIPFENMVYFGDGMTDVPSMKLICSSGGNSFCVYDPDIRGRKKSGEQLRHEGRVNHVVQADFEEGSQLFKECQNIILGKIGHK